MTDNKPYAGDDRSPESDDFCPEQPDLRLPLPSGRRKARAAVPVSPNETVPGSLEGVR